MRILHTSDWHLGRQFHGVSLDDDHDSIIAQFDAAIAEHQPDVLIIAGDIFDRPTPSQSALRRLSDFIRTVGDTGNTAIVLIAGNHDAAAQIGAMGMLANPERALVRGPLDRDERPLLLTDAHGTVAISALPFGYEFAARACYESDAIHCPADVLAEQIASAKRHLPEGARWVVVAHAFVEGASTSEGERPLTRAVGADHIRYSGAPLAFGFDEEGHGKSMALVDLAADGSISLTELPVVPLRQVRAIRGKLVELLAAPKGSADLIRVILTDEHPQIDPMRRIRVLYPNAVQLTYERDEAPREQRLADGRAALDQPREVVANFVQFVRDSPITDAEAALVDGAVAELVVQEDGA